MLHKQKKHARREWAVVGLVVLMIALAGPLYAGEALPWDSGLKKFADGLTGTTAMYISLIAGAFTAYQMIWGGEMGDLGRKMTMIVLVTSILVGLSAFLKNIVGLQITGAEVASLYSIQTAFAGLA